VVFSLLKDICFLDAHDARFRKMVSEGEGWKVPQEQGKLISELFLSDLGGFALCLGGVCKKCVSLVNDLLFHNGTLQCCKNNRGKL